MQLKRVLNRVHPVKGFVYERAKLIEDPSTSSDDRIEVTMRERRGSRAICSGCGEQAPAYDRLAERRFDFVPLWNMAVVLIYALRRVDCPRCGVKVERVPWARGKRRTTLALESFLSGWAERLSWSQVAAAFGFSWETVYRGVAAVVDHGLAHRDLSNIGAIGVDEVARRKGHRYLTLIYQLDGGCRRLLHVAEGRRVESFAGFFDLLGRERCAAIQYVCSDMWKPYLKVIRERLSGAVHILDRYHIVASLNRAMDKVRAEEARRLKAEGYEAHLAKTRWCFLKRKANLTVDQRRRLREVLKFDLRSVRAYLLVQALHPLWDYVSPAWAEKYLDLWCRRVMRSRIEPLKEVARSLREHRELILNWFRAKKQYNAGIVEGMNANVKLRFRKAYGIRTMRATQVALYHDLGDLPRPPTTHRFC